MSVKNNNLTTKQKRAILKKRVESLFSQYRLYKYLTPAASYDTKITASSSELERVMHSDISNQTAMTAIKIADDEKERRDFIEAVEAAVKHLPPLEREVIDHRYLSRDSEYITDANVYNFKLSEPMSAPKYTKIRNVAFIKLALSLQIDVGFDLTAGI